MKLVNNTISRNFSSINNHIYSIILKNTLSNTRNKVNTNFSSTDTVSRVLSEIKNNYVYIY